MIFYGCWSREKLGHYFYNAAGFEPRWHRNGALERGSAYQHVPWNVNVDGGLAPRDTQGGECPNGLAAFHQCVSYRVGEPQQQVWSALSWWDNSADRRPGSSATFITEALGTHVSPSKLLHQAREAFPTVFERFNYQIVVPPTDEPIVRGLTPSEANITMFNMERRIKELESACDIAIGHLRRHEHEPALAGLVEAVIREVKT